MAGEARRLERLGQLLHPDEAADRPQVVARLERQDRRLGCQLRRPVQQCGPGLEPFWDTCPLLCLPSDCCLPRFFVLGHADAPGSFVPEDHVCTPVLNLGYPSIGWSSYYKKFIAVGSKIWDCSDIVFALSDDLVNWSAPYPLYQPTCHTASPTTSYYAEIYPSLIDPASPSPNFDVIGRRPYIYFMTFHDNVKAPSGGTTVVRSIQRRPLEMGGGVEEDEEAAEGREEGGGG